MLDKYLRLSDSMKIVIDLDSTRFLEGIEHAIKIKIGNKKKEESMIKVNDN